MRIASNGRIRNSEWHLFKDSHVFKDSGLLALWTDAVFHSSTSQRGIWNGFRRNAVIRLWFKGPFENMLLSPERKELSSDMQRGSSCSHARRLPSGTSEIAQIRPASARQQPLGERTQPSSAPSATDAAAQNWRMQRRLWPNLRLRQPAAALTSAACCLQLD